MEKRGPSRFKPKSVKEIADLAERRAAQDKLDRNHPLQARDQAVLEDIERSRKIAEEQAEEETRNLASYARRNSTFDIFYANVERVAEASMSLWGDDLEGDALQEHIVAIARKLNSLPNISVSSPAYKAVVESIYLFATEDMEAKGELIKNHIEKLYKTHIQSLL